LSKWLDSKILKKLELFGEDSKSAMETAIAPIEAKIFFFSRAVAREKKIETDSGNTET
jgi:hypothetical protein